VEDFIKEYRISIDLVKGESLGGDVSTILDDQFGWGLVCNQVN
jgi:hypothetical protein